ncbi:MAG: 50S ribosomal protein L22 [bacterium]|nr:50S ribosomal protein L22 [bacterium]
MATKTKKVSNTKSKAKQVVVGKEVRAQAKFLKGSAKKIRRVANEVRGLPVTHALSLLKSLSHRGADLLYNVVKSAASNAAHNNKEDLGNLVISTLLIDEGPYSTRFRARARGRIFPIIKKTSHITVGVQSRGVK